MNSKRARVVSTILLLTALQQFSPNDATAMSAAVPPAKTDQNTSAASQASPAAIYDGSESNEMIEALTPDSAPPAETGLTLDKVMREVLAAGFEARLAELNVDATRADARALAAIANPAVSFGVGRALGYDPNAAGSNASANQYSVGLSDQGAISDLISGKRGIRKDIGHQMVKLSSLQRDDAIRLVSLAAKQQFCAVVLSQARQRLADRILKSALETEKLVRARYNSGAALPDLLRAEAVTLDARQGLRAARIQLASDRAQLALLMGRTGLQNTDLDESLLLSAALPRIDVAPADVMIQQAENRRPDRAAANVAVEQAASSLRLARRNRWPDIELQLGYTQQGQGNSAIQPATVSFTLTAPIPVFYQNQGQIERALVDASTRTVERERLTRQIASAVQTSLDRVNSAREQTTFAGERLVRARRAFQMVRLQYKEGATSLVDLLEATRSYSDAEDNYLEARESLWMQLFQLEYDAGKELIK